MGSGREKTRRARAAAPAPAASQDVHVDLIRWDAFVKEQGLRWVTVAEYYDAKPGATIPSKRGLDLVSNQRALAVATELFHDLVDTRAIVLPASADVDDFFFEWIRDYTLPHDGDDECLVLKTKKSFNFARCLGDPRKTFNNDVEMDSREIRAAVQSIAWACENLCSQSDAV